MIARRFLHRARHAMPCLPTASLVSLQRQQIGHVRPDAHVQFAGDPLQRHRGFRAQPFCDLHLAGISLATCFQIPGFPLQPFQLFCDQTQCLLLIRFCTRSLGNLTRFVNVERSQSSCFRGSLWRVWGSHSECVQERPSIALPQEVGLRS